MKQHVEERQILWGHLDSLGIVFYPRYYEWIDDCGHLFFNSIGLNIGRLIQKKNIAFSLVETSCRYLMPGRYFQKIKIITFIEELTEKTITLKHLIKSSPEDQLMVEGIEKRICVNTADSNNIFAINIPEDIRAILRDAQG